MLLAEPGSEHLVSEVADLWFHSMLLLARDGLDPLAPLAELGAGAAIPLCERDWKRTGEAAFSLDTVWMLRYPWQAGTIRPAAQPFSGRKVA